MQTSSTTRRQFLQRSAAITGNLCAIGALTPLVDRELQRAPLYDDRGYPRTDDGPLTKDPRVTAMLRRAIDSAVAGGASYAEARFTHRRNRAFPGGNVLSSQILDSKKLGQVGDTESIAVGVRALVGGYWGYAAGPVWTVEEGARLGAMAANLATENSRGGSYEMALAPRPIVQTGHWESPVQIDPFEIHPTQIFDIMCGLCVYGSMKNGIMLTSGSVAAGCYDTALLTSDGTHITQRSRDIGIELKVFAASQEPLSESVEEFGRGRFGATGLEIINEDRMRSGIDAAVEYLKWKVGLPILPLDVGRFPTLLSARTVSHLLGGSIGAATELDRVLGYEANAGGTSYLKDPVEMLGTYVVASPHISVTADRSMAKGLASIGWDDEGVVPMETPLVTKGVLTNYQTTRETAAWLASATSRSEAKSTGCALGPSAVDVPVAHTANLTLHPGSESTSTDTLLRELKKGVYIKEGMSDFDFQKFAGGIGGEFFEVVNGKIVARLVNSSVLFRSPELWKGITAIGGSNTVERFEVSSFKGEPTQWSPYTVSAVPLFHGALSYIDPTRKA